jgi:uncharacterized protein (TIGR00730 family)
MKPTDIQKLAVFCGSSAGNIPLYARAAESLAEALCTADIGLVYGGGNVGLMGILADRVLAQGGQAIGVIPKSLVQVELAHTELTEIHIVETMHERKALMAVLSDGYIMLPGGPGSLDEFFEMVTWAQLGYHSKPCGILNTNGYYDNLLTFLDHATEKGFMQPVYRNMLIVEESAATLIQRFQTYQAPLEKKWVS